MTLDRDAARALFDNAPAPVATAGGSTPFASVSPFGETDEHMNARLEGRAHRRKGPDWRLIAPVGVAAVCAVAVLVVAQTRDPAEPGKDVAASSPMAPLTPPSALPPVETAEVVAPAAASIAPPPAAAPAPVARTTVRTAPARQAPAPRSIAVAPSATDASSNVSTYERYVPPPAPSLGAPVTVTPAPIAPPAPAPIVAEPTPDPTIPPQ